MSRSFNPVRGIVAILLAALTLRVIFTGVSPHQLALQDSLNASYSEFGLLAALPQFSAGLFSFLIPLAMRYANSEQITLAGLVLMASLILTPLAADSLHLVYLLFIVGGAGISLAQPAMQAVIKHHYPTRTLQMVSLTILGLHSGAGFTAVVSPYLAQNLGGWAWSLSFLGVLIAVCAIFWAITFSTDLNALGRRPKRAYKPKGRLHRQKITWLITIYFVSSGTVYISLLSWLPGYFLELGKSAQYGANMLGAFVFCQALSALTLTIFSRDHWGRRKLLTVGTVLTALGITVAVFEWQAGIELFPILTGLGLGISFPVAMSLPHAYGSTPQETAKLTMFALGIGSMLCAPFPFIVGWIKDIELLQDPLVLIVMASTIVMALIIPTLKPPPHLRPTEC